MYEHFFEFTEKPFNITPDPKYFFSSPKHLEALDSLIYAIHDRRGFVVITGEIGSGKTITCRTLLTRLDKTAKVAIITNTHLTNKQLILNILEEFSVPVSGGDKYSMVKQLNEFLLEEYSHDNQVVLIIDEAQNLSRQALEEVRMLSNLETEKAKLIQIILMGQPELKDKLYHKKLAQLRQRIAIHYHLNPLTKDETRTYIQYRLSKASQNGSPLSDLFAEDAIDLIFKYSDGVPRLINIICDNSLLSAYANDQRRVTAEIVHEALKDNTIFEHKERELFKETPTDPEPPA
jgi:general secretion pathway protein A